MYASNQRPVYLRAATVLNAAGDHCADLLHAAPAPQPLSFDASREAFCLGTPKLAGKVFERKILRGLEPQGLRILHCAAGLAEALAALELPAQRIVLTAAIPEVDGPSTSWEAVQAILEQPEQLLAQFMAHTPPMHALTLLNSSVMAYVAQGLGCRGAMGGFCSQSNAGVDALAEAFHSLAEAFHSLAEGRGDAALVVGSSPNISPALYLREPAQAQRLYGEGAAALLLSHRASADALRIAGIARGYSANASQAAAVAGRVIAQALRAERLTLGDVQQVVCDRRDPLVVSLFGPEQTLLDSLQPRVGDLGAGQLLSEAALALYRQQHAAQPVAYTLLLDRSQAGHWGAVLLAAPAKEAV